MKIGEGFSGVFRDLEDGTELSLEIRLVLEEGVNLSVSITNVINGGVKVG